MNHPTRRFPPEPLLQAMAAAGVSDKQLRKQGIWIRPTRGFITERTADRAAVALGTHGALIWGACWYEETAA